MGVNVRNDHGTAITFLRERVHNAATNSIIAGKPPAWEMLLKEEHDSRGRHWATWTDRKTVRHRRTSKQGLIVAIPTASSRRSELGQSSRMSKGSVESHINAGPRCYRKKAMPSRTANDYWSWSVMTTRPTASVEKSSPNR